MMPQTKGVPALIEKMSGNPITLVYVGSECLLAHPTNQDAWETLKSLVAVVNGEDDWPQEVYLVLVLHNNGVVQIPQIGRVEASAEDQSLKYVELWGEDYAIFHEKVMTDWPSIKESDYVARLLLD